MSMSASVERRAPSDAGHASVRRSHHPAVRGLSRGRLGGLARRSRDRRDRTRDISRRWRREPRGEADPRGATAAGGDAGTKLEARVLAGALKRVDGEPARHAQEEERARHTGSMREALGCERPRVRRHPDPGRTAGEGGRPSFMKARTGRADTA